MFQRNHDYFALVPFLLSIIGVSFCAFNALNVSEPGCITSGCTLFHGFSIAGISMWWLGTVFFSTVFLLSIFKKLYYIIFFAGLGLLIDCFLLIILILTLPCLSCLGVALLIALIYYFARQEYNNKENNHENALSPMLIIWACLVVINLSLSVKESVKPYSISSANNQNQVVAYVSPSCPSCIELVRNISKSNLSAITWYPVAEDENDIFKIAKIQELISQGQDFQTAFVSAVDNASTEKSYDLLYPTMLYLQFKLFVNKAHVLSDNGGVMPYIKFSGLPSFMLQKKQAEEPKKKVENNVEPSAEKLFNNMPSDETLFNDDVLPNSQALPQTNDSSELPLDLEIVGSCDEQDPC